VTAVAQASPSPAQSAAKGMSSHATDLAVYAESSSPSSSSGLKVDFESFEVILDVFKKIFFLLLALMLDKMIVIA